MNKYEKAYNELWSVLHNEPASEIEKHSVENKKRLELLKAIVERATSKKPHLCCGKWKCSNCQNEILSEDEQEFYQEPKFCSECGQALDWSEDDDGE